MKVSDYIVDFLVEKGITDFFGYQGTMISYFVDSIGRNPKANNHSCYNEQGAAFAACGASQVSGNVAVAYATSGPGAMNLMSGAASAYYDSLPVLFITGQVNTYEYVESGNVRQHSFQEADIVGMAKPVTKYAVMLKDASMIRYELEKAFWIATSARKGSVLLDIPMNLQRAEIDPEELLGFNPEAEPSDLRAVLDLYQCLDFSDDLAGATDFFGDLLRKHERPAFLLGNGVSRSSADKIVEFAKAHSIPVITTLLGKGLVDECDDVSFGYIGGAYGTRVANLIASKKADLLVCIGTSFVTRQTGIKVDQFAQDATIARIDTDPHSFVRKAGRCSYSVYMDSASFSDVLYALSVPGFDEWYEGCRASRRLLKFHDDSTAERFPNVFISRVSDIAPEDAVVSTDVGQHMMWIAQSYPASRGQFFLFSGGHGAMGYSLPAAIGASYLTDSPLLVFAGDGSIQMNIQELQWVVRENLPLKIFILNNHSLGMVRVQQKVYFDHNFEGTSSGYNYEVPDFLAIAKAYGLRSVGISHDDDVAFLAPLLQDSDPLVVVVDMPEDSFAYPKTLLGNPIYNQDPELPEALLETLLSL